MASMIGYILFQIISGFKLFPIILLLLFSHAWISNQPNEFSQLIDQMIASERPDR